MPTLFERLFRKTSPSVLAREKWNDGLHGELQFWQDWFATKGSHWPDDYAARLDPDTQLWPDLCDLLPEGNARILDVGAGPMTILGKKCPGREVSITAVDALTPAYDVLIREAGVNPPVRTLHCEA